MKMRLFSAVLFTLVSVFVFSGNNVYAASASCFFTSTAGSGGIIGGTGTCSVSGNGEYATNDVLVGRNTDSSGYAIPLPADSSEAADFKDAFVSTITGKFYYGDNHDRVGAAFIIQAMRGATTWPTDADVDAWVTFMNDPNVTVTSVMKTGITNTSWYDDGKRNTFFGNYSTPVNRQVIRVSYTGNLLAEVEHSCGNMLANVIPFWMPYPTASVKSQAIPGEVVTWKYKVVISGTAKTTQAVRYGRTAVSTNQTNTTRTQYDIIPIGSPVGTAVEFTYNYTVRATDIGKKLCSRSYARPRAINNTGYIYSITGGACVTIVSTLTPTVGCRPITISVKPKSYSEVNYSDGGGYVRHQDALTPQPLDVYIGNDKIGTYTSDTIIDDPDITRTYTDGKAYKVTFKESEKHVTSWSTNRYKINKVYVDGVLVSYDWAYNPPTPHYTQAEWYDAFQCYDYKTTANDVTISNDIVEANSVMRLGVSLSSASFTSGTSSPVANLNLHTKTKESTWQISQIVIQPGAGNPDTIANSGDVPGSASDNPCGYYVSNIGVAATCSAATSITNVAATATTSQLRNTKTVFSTSGGYISTSGGKNPATNYVVVNSNFKPGTIICYAFSIFASSSEPKNGVYDIGKSSVLPSEVDTDGGSWNHSELSDTNCALVVKKPKAQVWGGDVWTGRTVNSANIANSNVTGTTSVKKIASVPNINLYGSWVEYGILSPGRISGVASASAFSGPTGMLFSNSLTTGTSVTSAMICNFSLLSFTNTPAGSTTCSGSSSTIGGYSNSQYMPYTSSISWGSTGATTTTGGNLSSFSNGRYKANSNISISGDLIGAGKWVIIDATTATVTINGNINYTTSKLRNINEIPQVLIFARNINIADNVTNVDAWLIASDTINTCPTFDRTANTCSNLLTINGPVQANHLLLNRTGGNETPTGSVPAEKINLRADAYLWAYNYNTKSNVANTTYINEVPPRF